MKLFPLLVEKYNCGWWSQSCKHCMLREYSYGVPIFKKIFLILLLQTHVSTYSLRYERYIFLETIDILSAVKQSWSHNTITHILQLLNRIYTHPDEYITLSWGQHKNQPVLWRLLAYQFMGLFLILVVHDSFSPLISSLIFSLSLILFAWSIVRFLCCFYPIFSCPVHVKINHCQNGCRGSCGFYFYLICVIRKLLSNAIVSGFPCSLRSIDLYWETLKQIFNQIRWYSIDTSSSGISKESFTLYVDH